MKDFADAILKQKYKPEDSDNLRKKADIRIKEAIRIKKFKDTPEKAVNNLFKKAAELHKKARKIEDIIKRATKK